MTDWPAFVALFCGFFSLGLGWFLRRDDRFVSGRLAMLGTITVAVVTMEKLA